jgi:hypothetical protein
VRKHRRAVDHRRSTGACRGVDRSVNARASGALGQAQLAALRHLFDWLVNGHVMPVNPAHTERGPGSSPRPVKPRCSIRRKRALIGLMVYSFARMVRRSVWRSRMSLDKTATSWCGYARRAASATRCIKSEPPNSSFLDPPAVRNYDSA